MKMKEAMEIIEGKKDGFMVSFEWARNGMLYGDHFPDKHAGEDLIPTEKEAWMLAAEFAKKTVGKAVNIYVINADFTPVAGVAVDPLVMRDFPQKAAHGSELRRQIMSSTVPKNEREHWAARRIEELEAAMNDLLNDCINFDGAKLTDCIMAEASKVLKKYDA